MRKHVEALRATQCFGKSRIVLVAEANLANEAQEIAEDLIGMAGLSVLCSREDSYGVWTLPGLKKMFVFRVGDLFAKGAVSYHQQLVVANPFQTSMKPDERVIASRKEFERQLRSFRRIHLLPRALTGKVIVAFTGKADKDNQQSNRLKDDMCMAFLIGVYMSGQHMNGLIKERGYRRKFVSADGRPIASTVADIAMPAAVGTSLSAAMAATMSAGVSRARDESAADASELESYASRHTKRRL